MEDALKGHTGLITNFQSVNDMVKALRLVFTYLKRHELLIASQVCSTWNLIAMDKFFWQTVCLKNYMVCSWDKCIDAINNRGSVTLDLRHMLVPTDIYHFEKFWSDFKIAIKKAQRLKCLELYKCPPSVIWVAISLLPQLTVINATSIKNSNISRGKLILLSLPPLSKITNLTELRIKGLTGLKLENLPSLESLVNLKALSLTSIRTFPYDICCTLNTLSTSLVFLEIGGCNYLSKDFAGVLKRLNNLTSLRLENCLGGFEKFSKEVISAIRGLDKLKILELINIEFSNIVEGELEKCTNIKALLIIPVNVNYAPAANRHVMDCLYKLSKTLTHLVWGLTSDLLYSTELHITHEQLKLHTMGYSSELLHNYHKEGNHIPIVRTRKRKMRPGEESLSDLNELISLSDINILPVPALEIILENIMVNAETKVVKIPLKKTTQVYLLEHFNNL